MFEILIKQVTKVIHRYEEREERPSEEATKHALVLPFIRDVLGADYLNPEEVIPEFTADIGERKGEKVDYAVCRDDEPTILIECKALYSALDSAATIQLERYVNSRLGVSLGILTNGRHYHFYADLDQPNVLDAEPFLSVDLMELTPTEEERLKLFHADRLDVQAIKEAGQAWKTVASLVQALETEWEQPSDGYVTHFARPLHKKGSLTESVRRQYAGYLKEAQSLFLAQRTGPLPPPEQTDSPPPPESWQPLTDLETRGPEPQVIRFVDGSTESVGSWPALLSAVVLKLDAEGHFSLEDRPSALRQILYVPSEPLKKYLCLPSGLVTNLYLSPFDCLQRSKKFLQACGYNPADVHVK